FGNPYGDLWSAAEAVEVAKLIGGMGIPAISIADTAGVADGNLVRRVMESVSRECADIEVGIHMHTTRAGAREKILAAYDAGCRRFDSAIGGLGGCPFAQDELVGNVPTEEVFRALQTRGLNFPMESSLKAVKALNDEI